MYMQLCTHVYVRLQLCGNMNEPSIAQPRSGFGGDGEPLDVGSAWLCHVQRRSHIHTYIFALEAQSDDAALIGRGETQRGLQREMQPGVRVVSNTIMVKDTKGLKERSTLNPHRPRP